jgi:23S rRNA (adenine1618-N6)-methyltransferase
MVNSSRYDLVVTNPPFFSTVEEKRELEKNKFEAKNSEVVCSGGELGFVSQMIEESLALSSPSILYCVYIGRKETIKLLVERFKANSKLVIFSETLYQGTTARWLLGWRVFKAGHTYSDSLKLGIHHGFQTTSPYVEHGLHEDN